MRRTSGATVPGLIQRLAAAAVTLIDDTASERSASEHELAARRGVRDYLAVVNAEFSNDSLPSSLRTNSAGNSPRAPNCRCVCTPSSQAGCRLQCRATAVPIVGIVCTRPRSLREHGIRRDRGWPPFPGVPRLSRRQGSAGYIDDVAVTPVRRRRRRHFVVKMVAAARGQHGQVGVYVDPLWA